MRKVLNLYAGIGGNRKLWADVEVTAVELNPEIAKIYQDFFPDDKVIVADAHQYLLDHYADGWDFIWSSPPCPSHSITNKFLEAQGVRRYPDMNLYQEIIYLHHYANCKYAIENVMSYYEPLVLPQKVDRHYYWTNFIIPYFEVERDFNYGNCRESGKTQTRGRLDTKEYRRSIKEFLGIDCDNLDYLRNCVHPTVGLHIFNMAFKHQQMTFKDMEPGKPEQRITSGQQDSAESPKPSVASADRISVNGNGGIY